MADSLKKSEALQARAGAAADRRDLSQEIRKYVSLLQQTDAESKRDMKGMIAGCTTGVNSGTG